MSQATLQEARTLSEQLSAAEKIQLIEWLSAQLRQEFDAPHQPTDPDAQPSTDASTDASTNGHNHMYPDTFETSTAATSADNTSGTWTDEEIQAMMKSAPKTGPEIVALLQKLDLRSWEEQEIPDVVEWLEDRRAQSRRLRQAQWDTIDS